mmetsp:Transcript_49309/g.154884  ORF Transcript_49309/g.154884 Transcript_49309/m.154884 type:complete len:220 (-) Transcript_49309:314-973(-)
MPIRCVHVQPRLLLAARGLGRRGGGGGVAWMGAEPCAPRALRHDALAGAGRGRARAVQALGKDCGQGCRDRVHTAWRERPDFPDAHLGGQARRGHTHPLRLCHLHWWLLGRTVRLMVGERREERRRQDGQRRAPQDARTPSSGRGRPVRGRRRRAAVAEEAECLCAALSRAGRRRKGWCVARRARGAVQGGAHRALGARDLVWVDHGDVVHQPCGVDCS